MENELIVLKQLPIIEEQLKTLEVQIKEETSKALALEVNSENIQEAKKIRADLNKLKTDLETRRKEVKKAILKPYEEFEVIYNDCVKNHLTVADEDLKSKVDMLENGVKEEKRNSLIVYFEENKKAYFLEDMDALTFEKAIPNITLSTTETSYKKRIIEMLERVQSDKQAILSNENAEEILVEYEKTFDLSKSLELVNIRKKAIEDAKLKKIEAERIAKEQEEQRKSLEQIAKAKPVPQPIAKPVEEPIKEEIKEVEPVLKITFTVTGTKEKLKELKNFLNNGGYKYE